MNLEVFMLYSKNIFYYVLSKNKGSSDEIFKELTIIIPYAIVKLLKEKHH